MKDILETSRWDKRDSRSVDTRGSHPRKWQRYFRVVHFDRDRDGCAPCGGKCKFRITLSSECLGPEALAEDMKNRPRYWPVSGRRPLRTQLFLNTAVYIFTPPMHRCPGPRSLVPQQATLLREAPLVWPGLVGQPLCRLAAPSAK
jgi:hypothetical protein